MNDRTIAVDVENVVKVYGHPVRGFKALKNVSIQIKDNEFFTLLGPSGCGKTTLLRMIAGFEAPTAGKIRLHGENIENLPPNKRRVNTVFQSYALFPHMTLSQNIAFGLKMLKWSESDKRKRVDEMLMMVQMVDFADRFPEQLSGGQRQRVALARALAPRPKVLLLDEPLSALDLKLRQAMRQELKELQQQTGITFVFVTHDQEEALAMSDRICVIGSGEVQQLGSPQEIYEQPRNRFIADFIGETNFLDVEVLSIKNDCAVISTPFGVEITAQQKGVFVGEKATMSIRPGKLLIGRVDGAIQIQGKVTQKTYMGESTHYRVKVGNAAELLVSENHLLSDHRSHNLGDQIDLSFYHNSVRVLGQ